MSLKFVPKVQIDNITAPLGLNELDIPLEPVQTQQLLILCPLGSVTVISNI